MEFPIIAKLGGDQYGPRPGEQRRRAAAPGAEPESAIIVSFSRQPEDSGDYAARVQGAARGRRDAGRQALDPGRRDDVEAVSRRIDETQLPQEEKARLDTLLEASPMISDGDWSDFISRVDNLVTLRDALYRATEAIARESVPPEQLFRFPPGAGAGSE